MPPHNPVSRAFERDRGEHGERHSDLKGGQIPDRIRARCEQVVVQPQPLDRRQVFELRWERLDLIVVQSKIGERGHQTADLRDVLDLCIKCEKVSGTGSIWLFVVQTNSHERVIKSDNSGMYLMTAKVSMHVAEMCAPMRVNSNRCACACICLRAYLCAVRGHYLLLSCAHKINTALPFNAAPVYAPIGIELRFRLE